MAKSKYVTVSLDISFYDIDGIEGLLEILKYNHTTILDIITEEYSSDYETSVKKIEEHDFN